MKNLIIALFIICSFPAIAQKRNIVKPLCFDWEYMDYMVDGSNENLSNVFNFKIGYERLIGRRLSAGLSYVKFLSSVNDIDGNYYFSGYAPENISGYPLDKATYENKMQGFEYESRYFFNDLEKDGLNSGYLGFMYGYLTSKQSLTNVSYYNYNDPNDRFTREYPGKEVNIHRFGLKIGYAVSGVIYSDIHVGVFYNNRPDGYNKGWKSPSDIYPVNVVLGWHFGFPF
ncbi:MAG: hypothetical protein V4658_01285 [Bacteroidota bacterium]